MWSTALPREYCIEGDLVVTGRTQSDLKRLEGLVEVTGSLLVQNNPGLVELSSLPALRRIGGSLAIAHNEALTAVRGLPALEELSGELYVGDNPRLAAFTLGSEPLAIGAVFFALNQSLTELSLPEISEVEDDLRVMSNEHLQRLALPALRAVGGDFMLDDNPWLETVDGSALRRAERWTVTRNEKLAALDGFPALTEVAFARLADNDALSAVRWSARVEHALVIEDNDALEHIEGEPPGGSFRLTVTDNASLHELSGFSALRELDVLRVANNPALVELGALSGLETVRTLSIHSNAALVGPEDWLPALAEVRGDLSMYDNAQLPPALVDALLARVHVVGSTRVGDNKDQMTELDPCPWPGDGVCDEDMGIFGAGTSLCASDAEDCAPVGP